MNGMPGTAVAGSTLRQRLGFRIGSTTGQVWMRHVERVLFLGKAIVGRPGDGTSPALLCKARAWWLVNVLVWMGNIGLLYLGRSCDSEFHRLSLE